MHEVRNLRGGILLGRHLSTLLGALVLCALLLLDLIKDRFKRRHVDQAVVHHHQVNESRSAGRIGNQSLQSALLLWTSSPLHIDIDDLRSLALVPSQLLGLLRLIRSLCPQRRRLSSFPQ